MIGGDGAVWPRFGIGVLVIVGLATLMTLILIHRHHAAQNVDGGYGEMMQTEQVKATHVWAINYRHPPRSSDRTIQILATSDGYCVGTQHRPIGEHALAHEARASVLVSNPTVREFPSRGGTCAGIGYVAPVTVSLTRPLGSRAVLAPVKGGAIRTLWPSEAQFQCIRAIGGAIADKRVNGATTRDQIRTMKEVPGLFRAEDKWGTECGLHRDR